VPGNVVDYVAAVSGGLRLVPDAEALKNAQNYVMRTAASTASHGKRFVVMSRVHREPLKFGPDEWLEESAVGKELWRLLLGGMRELSEERTAEVRAFFATTDRFQRSR
jgi:hypothetical protein